MTDVSKRLFFALWPGQTVRDQFQHNYDEAAKRLGIACLGQPVARSNLHITLHYLGKTGAAYERCFIEQAHQVGFRPFDLVINRLGFFKHAAVSWVAPQQTPEELSLLHGNLRKHLAVCGYAAEKRPYRPHITMARHLKPELDGINIPPIKWQVESFVLVNSIRTPHGVMYQVIERFA